MVDLNEPIEVAIRGDRVDVIGFMSFFSVFMDELDTSSYEEARAMKVVDDVITKLKQQENMALVGREMKKVIGEEGDVNDYRGVDVQVSSFNPQHPSVSDIEEFPPLEEAEQYVVIGNFGDGLHGVGYPTTFPPDDGLMLASYLRMYAREIEEEVDSLGEDLDVDAAEGGSP